jgi:hypothetical protein
MRALGEVTDAKWAVVEPLLQFPRRADGRGRPPADTRAVLNGVLWILRFCAPGHSGTVARVTDGFRCSGCWTLATRYPENRIFSVVRISNPKAGRGIRVKDDLYAQTQKPSYPSRDGHLGFETERVGRVRDLMQMHVLRLHVELIMIRGRKITDSRSLPSFSCKRPAGSGFCYALATRGYACRADSLSLARGLMKLTAILNERWP